ncbi:MAG: DUF4105 domain-containing protein [Oligoflexia bacterium]|nr:DUF4105 domain-containing protein [Oligoflexia bacterium]MBF0366912.1 DUF4105 domain-containing protein [Oligoflexia bacterium]
MKSTLFFISFFCFSLLPLLLLLSLLSHAHANDLAFSSYWLKLIHYKKSALAGYKGQVDSPQFYLAANGKFDPVAEWNATLTAFQNSDSFKDDSTHPQCRFPERYRFLKQQLKLKLKDVKDASCSDFKNWITSLAPQGAALVYASNYPNNPGSIFGHTYLKVISQSDSRLQGGPENTSHLDLLDYSISYAANADSSNMGLTYAFNGIFGGYLGLFSLQPSYMKVAEYSDREDRDLWEFQLNINAEEATRMMNHYWELTQNAYFDYFFFDENCSYQILTLLEVARPDWKLSERVWAYLAPADSVKLVADNSGAITEVRFRPSLYKRTMKKINALKGEQQQLFRSIIASYSLDKLKHADSKSLEAITSYLFYRKQVQLNKLDSKQSELYSAALSARALRKASPEVEELTYTAPKDNSPEQAHDSVQIALSSGVNSYEHFQELLYRPALHDALNNAQGYANFTQLEILKARARYYHHSKKIYLEELTILNVMSLLSFDLVEKNYSWRLDSKLYMPKDLGTTRRHALLLRPLGGYAFTTANESAIFFAMIGINLEAQDSFAHLLRFGPLFNLGTLVNIGKHYKLQLSSNLLSDLFQHKRQKYFWEHSLHQSLILARNWDARLQLLWIRGKQENNYSEGRVSLSYHF